MAEQPTPEPVIAVEVVRVILAGAVAAGWLTLDDTRVMTVATAVAGLASIGGSLWARARVTPLGRRWFG